VTTRVGCRCDFRFPTVQTCSFRLLGIKYIISEIQVAYGFGQDGRCPTQVRNWLP
jgi:hypothetical protein